MKKLLTLALRWITIIPGAILAYIATKFINDFISFSYLGDLAYDINTFSGFGGHLILGPIYIFQRELIAAAAATYAISRITPKYQKIVVYFLGGIWLLISLGGFYYVFTQDVPTPTTQNLMRVILETIAQGAGFVLIIVSLAKNTTIADKVKSEKMDQKTKKDLRKLMIDALQEERLG